MAVIRQPKYECGKSNKYPDIWTLISWGCPSANFAGKKQRSGSEVGIYKRMILRKKERKTRFRPRKKVRFKKKRNKKRSRKTRKKTRSRPRCRPKVLGSYFFLNSHLRMRKGTTRIGWGWGNGLKMKMKLHLLTLKKIADQENVGVRG